VGEYAQQPTTNAMARMILQGVGMIEAPKGFDAPSIRALNHSPQLTYTALNVHSE
jgi:hypothetical protein